MHRALRISALAALAVGLLAAAAQARSDNATAQAAEPVVLVGAGDIASCQQENDEATARLLDQIPGTVFTLGDNVYTAGTAAEFAACYEPTWGRHKARTRPAAGNHDYLTPGGTGYHAYFGDAAGPLGKGYYSYTAGAWKIIVLNANCGQDPTVKVTPDPDYPGNPCGPGSPQYTWLEQELATSPDCTAAVIHYPLVTSGEKAPGYPHVKPFWDLLYEYSADVVLSGDDHIYERFARQTPDSDPMPVRGVRLFIIGTGGNNSYRITNPNGAPNSEKRRGLAAPNDPTYGVMKFTLADGSYAWEFVPVPGVPFTDSGTDTCSRGRAPRAAVSTSPDPAHVAEGGTVTFDGSATTDDRTPSSELVFQWDFDGDGAFDATGLVASHTYDTPGAFAARLRVTDGDGQPDVVTVPVTVDPACATGTFADDVEPAPEPGWQVDTAVNDSPASPTWQAVADPAAQSATQSWFTDGSTQSRKDDRLVSPPLDLGTTSRLTFWHRYLLEEGFDGGALEVSRDGGATWTDVTTAGVFLEGGYSGSVSAANPLATGSQQSRPAWTGASGPTMSRVVVDLSGFAGDDVRLRWRLGTDELSAPPGQGWWIDGVEVTGLVLPCNGPPVATDDAATTKKNKPVTIAVLANDSDPDGDALSIAAVGAPAHGTATATGALVTYTPAQGFRGTDSFPYTVGDGNGGTATATVTVVVR